ncbi:hypothetical protein N7520_002634 [Penicillium odoratum]|uniref:uncharacterized protein n=1 Tax=Penicillium odoratum TaxID=1167516 RepID=UPI0025499A32|nr:uncharacterized protein N7520_002634 [Penicillium odoratum]KAJ5772105.1 hypothetical protein N7520_002634 [Penicillium odoratum]
MTALFDVLGGISAVVQILQTAIEIADRIRHAKDKKSLFMILNQNHKEVTSLKDIVMVVKEEQSLHTKDIIAELANIATLAEELEDMLRIMEGKGFIGRFMHGKDHKAEVGRLTGNIAGTKLTLTMKIQNAHVGVTVLANRKLVVQMEKIEAVDANLKKLINGFEGLFIALLMKDRELNADGTVSINDSDFQSLGLETVDDSPYYAGSRLIENNFAFDQALMINGTIGTEGFIEPKDVKIFNNTARNQATMINASISEKTWAESREDRREIIKLMAAQGALTNLLEKGDPKGLMREMP